MRNSICTLLERRIQRVLSSGTVLASPSVSIIRDENIASSIHRQGKSGKEKSKAKTDSSTDTVVYDTNMDAATRMNATAEMQAEDVIEKR